LRGIDRQSLDSTLHKTIKIFVAHNFSLIWVLFSHNGRVGWVF